MRQPTRGRRGPPATRPPAPRRLRGVLEIDEGSGHATAHAGTRGPLLEEALNAAGLTLGHFPQSWEFSTLGGWIAKRAAGGLSNRYGRVGELLVGVRLVAPAGTIDLRPLPGEAHGPDLKELVLGSEGTLGVITRATVRAHPLPTARRFASRLFPSFADGLAALRGMAREGSLPDLAYLADEEETRFAAASAGIPPDGRPGGGGGGRGRGGGGDQGRRHESLRRYGRGPEPPPRDRLGPRPLPRTDDRGGRPRRPPGPQAGTRPRGDHEPGEARRAVPMRADLSPRGRAADLERMARGTLHAVGG